MPHFQNELFQDNPLEIIPGDYIVIDIRRLQKFYQLGVQRPLTTGKHRGVIISVLEKSARGPWHYAISFETAKPGLVISFKVKFTLSSSVHKICYVGSHLWPCKFTHEKNLEERLRLSIKALKAGE